MANKYQIGWQKYEDMLEQQMQSPLLANLYKSFYDNIGNYEETEIELPEGFSEEDLEELIKAQEKDSGGELMVPIDAKMMENMTLASTFDCWMGYTNFNITEDIKKTLNKTEGIEVLKICSRYRFFIGIGKMFDFTDVRRNIENKILEQEEEID